METLEAPPVQETQKPYWTPDRPGYRAPFNSETAKVASLKGVATRRAKRDAIQANTGKVQEFDAKAIASRLSLLRQAQTRAWRQSIASNNPDDCLKFAEVAKVAFEQEQKLLGKSGKVQRDQASKIPDASPPSALEPTGAQPLPTTGAS